MENKITLFFRYSIFLGLCFLTLLGGLSLYGKEVPPFPSGPVLDEAKLFKPQEKLLLEKYARAFFSSHDIQLQIYVASSLEGEVLENYTIKVVDQWKLGRKGLEAGSDRGILLFIALKERKNRLEVGRGLEGTYTDVFTGQLLDGLRPYLRQGDFFLGIGRMMNVMDLWLKKSENRKSIVEANPRFNFVDPSIAKYRKSQTGQNKSRGQATKLPWWSIPALFLFLFIASKIRLGRVSLLEILLMTFLASGGRRGGGGFGGGGGSWSGGGGGFGGGGSSSDW